MYSVSWLGKAAFRCLVAATFAVSTGCRPSPGTIRKHEADLSLTEVADLVPTLVAVDMMSGVPDEPDWIPSLEDIHVIRAGLSALMAADKIAHSPRPSEPLGYRGFVIVMAESSQLRRVRVYRGLVTFEFRDQRAPVSLRDSESALELDLLDAARNHFDDSLIEYLSQEIAR